MNFKYPLICFLLIGTSCFAQPKKQLPIIDMHLHALSANDQGPAPVKVGIPFDDLGLQDPKNDYGETFMQALKGLPFSKFISNKLNQNGRTRSN